MSLGNTYIVYIFEFQVYNDIALSYAGLAKLGGRPGQSAHFAATVKLQVCQENMTLCHFEGCWTFQPQSFEPQGSNLAFSTPGLSPMNISSMNFSTMNFFNLENTS